jgi:hypothetical protein
MPVNLAYAMTRGLRRAAIDDAGVVNVSGEVATLGFFDDTLNGDLTNGSPIIDGISCDPAVAGWLVGMSISTSGIPAGSTIVSIDLATQVTIS